MINNMINSVFSTLYFVGAFVNNYHVEFQQFCIKILRFLRSRTDFLARLSFRGDRICTPEVCKSCKKEISSKKSEIAISQEEILTEHDIEIVMARLGMEDNETRSEENCRDCGLLECALNLLEEKEANLEELLEAFSVFDENGDGFIDAIELHRVMCSLDLAEGKKLEECKCMIRAFDKNGDGCIDFHEFKKIMENGK